MNITFLCMGKTHDAWIETGIRMYQERLKHYILFSRVEVPDTKKGTRLSETRWKEEEGKLLLQRIRPEDRVILLDEKGLVMTSVQMAGRWQKILNDACKRVVVVVGGPYGFSPALYDRAQERWSLSALTFSHQMVRLLFIEQLYRSFTIIKGDPYHHA